MIEPIPAPPELERRLRALDVAISATDLHAAMRELGVDLSRTFEWTEFEGFDISGWSVSGLSFRGATLVRVKMTADQAAQIRATGPARLDPIIETIVPEQEFDAAPVNEDISLTDPWQEALRRIAQAKRQRLNKLDLSKLKIEAIPAAIADCGSVAVLYLNGTSVSDLSPLAGMTGLTALNLYGTGVFDLSPLAGMTGLTALNLNGTRVSDLSPLAGMTGLTTLNLNGTGVSDLSPLAGMTGLTTLDLGRTSVRDLSPLLTINNLQEVRVSMFDDYDVLPLKARGVAVLLAANRARSNV